MPQCSPAYAVGRVRVLESTLISPSSLERLAGSESVEDLCRALAEIGWGDAKSRKDIDRLCEEHMQKACGLVRDCSSDERVTNCFLIAYDAINLKTIYKSEALNLPASLSPLGTMDPDKLKRDVQERAYADLPERFREALTLIDKRTAVSLDPLFVDSEIDKAMYAYIDDNMSRIKDETIKNYFKSKADFVNLMIALRANAMKRGAAFARQLFVIGGGISFDELARIADDPEKAYDAIRSRPYTDSLSKSVKSLDLGAIERAQDDYLMGLMRPKRYEPTSIVPLIGYLLARSRETMAIRLIMAAIVAKTPKDKIVARLRAMY